MRLLLFHSAFKNKKFVFLFFNYILCVENEYGSAVCARRTNSDIVDCFSVVDMPVLLSNWRDE